MKHAIISAKPAFSAATSRILVWVCLGVAFLFVIAPLLFMLTAAFMPAGDIIKMPYRWFPRSFYFMNFVKAVAGNDGSYIFFRNLFNSLVVAVTVSITTVLISSLTGYSLSKFHYRGRDAIFMGIMATMMIPFEAIMIPLYIVVTKMGIQNSYPGLILPFLVNAFGIFMMRQYLITFPDELIDAARVDGMSEFAIYRRIILPNSGPVIATLAILSFRTQWDNLLWPLLVAQTEKMKTIPLYIVKFNAEMHTDEGAMMAVALLASIPMFILFFTLSKYFIKGSVLFSARKG